ncbi:uncharacterized protein LY89DRAFT_728899 [Mollisia scopiformis]|uniref:Uncharacterized protein n=1 Tax=Mollisia scopiformis TaxID=149040 RepID=A0A194XRK9_MOLSC|nr:uncharacterized protein LY89DRAFT_728899 [Mollisia scopiformis]KUJ22786.1 hypothetical protein LY89DRAFT_728899 [Mollisia scopiformis]
MEAIAIHHQLDASKPVGPSVKKAKSVEKGNQTPKRRRQKAKKGKNKGKKDWVKFDIHEKPERLPSGTQVKFALEETDGNGQEDKRPSGQQCAAEAQKKDPESGAEEYVTFVPGWGVPANFSIKKSDISKHCPTLKVAVNSSFLKTQNQTYKLKHCGPGTISMFREWIHTQRLDLDDKLADKVQRVKLRYDLAFLWCLAQELEMPGLRIAALDGICKIKEYKKGDGQFIPWCALQTIWSITTYDSALRQLYIDELIWGKFYSAWENHADLFNKEMLLQIATAYRKALSPFSESREKGREDYVVEKQEGKGKMKEQ